MPGQVELLAPPTTPHTAGEFVNFSRGTPLEDHVKESRTNYLRVHLAVGPPPARSALEAASSLCGVTMSGSTRTIKYVIWSSILVNQCPVPAGIIMTSPGFRSWLTPLRMEAALLPGPFISRTVSRSAGLLFSPTRSGPVTRVADPSMTW